MLKNHLVGFKNHVVKCWRSTGLILRTTWLNVEIPRVNKPGIKVTRILIVLQLRDEIGLHPQQWIPIQSPKVVMLLEAEEWPKLVGFVHKIVTKLTKSGHPTLTS